MKNFFAVLKEKLTRRQKKNKPVPVDPRPIKAVTYNRVDGVVSGGPLESIRVHETRPPLQQMPKGAYWDEEARVYKGTNYFVQAQEVDRIMREAELKARKKLPVRYDDYGGDDFAFYADSTIFDDAFFHQSEETRPERGYAAPDSPSGYDYPQTAPEAVYEASRAPYEATASTSGYDYGTSTVDSGSSWSSSSSSSDSGGGYSSSSSDSGGGYSGGGSDY